MAGDVLAPASRSESLLRDSRGRTAESPRNELPRPRETSPSSMERKDLSARTKSNLAQVPCKFFRQGSCTAERCPFSHDLPSPGKGKTICSWYLKGPTACKFGHKCALAHVLPGEPLSNDRKNKRAQQLAQRESAHRDAEQHRDEDGHGQQTSGTGEADYVSGSPPSDQPTPAATAVRGTRVVSATAGEPTYAAAAAARLSSSPPQQSPGLAVNNRATSTTSTSRPILVGHNQASTSSFRGGSPLFSTSPFSPPGTSSVFFSGSVGSEDGFRDGAGSSNAVRRPSPMRNQSANANAFTSRLSDGDLEDLTAAAQDDEADYESLGNSRHEEDCLPSSLSNLMTPDELRRRQRRMFPQSGSPNFSRSVPHAPPLESPSSSVDAFEAIHGSSPHRLNGHGTSSAYLHSVSLTKNLLVNHNPGSSLPPGLAAGLSRLHFQAPQHTGETPPGSQNPSPQAGATAPSQARATPNLMVGSPLARHAWQHSPALRPEDVRSPSMLKETVTTFDGEEMPFELEY